MNLLLLFLGLALLTIGGEALIRGSLAGAKRLRISPLLSGLVIVGFGTSAPELAVSVDAALHEQPDIAVGNVVGSNIGNILLILGICALIRPLAVKPLGLRRDAVTVVGAGLLFSLLAIDGELQPLNAILLLIALAAYLTWAYFSERSEAASEVHRAEAEELTVLPESIVWIVTCLVSGIALLVIGSKVLLVGAVGIATYLGVPEVTIGLTLVALGTSLPELTVSVIATIRRHTDVAVGNILGSNIFNLLGILGVSALLQPLPVHPGIQMFDQWVMLGTSMVLMLFLYTGHRLSRLEGGLLLAGYGGYIGLVLGQTGYPLVN